MVKTWTQIRRRLKCLFTGRLAHNLTWCLTTAEEPQWIIVSWNMRYFWPVDLFHPIPMAHTAITHIGPIWMIICLSQSATFVRCARAIGTTAAMIAIYQQQCIAWNRCGSTAIIKNYSPMKRRKYLDSCYAIFANIEYVLMCGPEN